jgi:NTP pyrophosphatase (non-canonical NTP hydrolase)
MDLTELQRSSRDLRERFDIDIPDFDAVMRKFYEEVWELSQRASEQHYSGMGHANTAEEMADVFVMLLQLADSLEINDEMLQVALNFVTLKNNAKTKETHEVIKGIITRKS